MFVLLLLAGAIMLASSRLGLSYELGIMAVIAFLGIELILTLYGKLCNKKYSIAPGIIVVLILALPVVVLYIIAKTLTLTTSGDLRGQIIEKSNIIRCTIA
jgi:hypothetical protein